MDVYKEQIVKKAPDKGDNIQKVLAIMMTAVLSFAVFFMILALSGNPIFALFFACLVLYGGYKILSGIYYEYEYILTNGELDIDKISGKAKRKRLVSFKINTFTDFGKVTDNNLDSGDRTQVIAHDNTGVNLYFADFNHHDHGQCRIYFSPNEEMLESIRKFLPSKLK